MAIQIRCRFDPAALDFEPSDNLDLELRWEGKFERPNRSLTPIRKTPLTLFPDPVGDPFNPVTYLPTEEAFGSPYVVESRPGSGTANILADLTTHGASFKSRWQFKDDWYLESITAYRSLSWDFVLDADSTPHPVDVSTMLAERGFDPAWTSSRVTIWIWSFVGKENSNVPTGH